MSPGLSRGRKVAEGNRYEGGNKHFLHTSVCRNKFFLLELHTNCIVLYGTTLKIFFWDSPVQSCTKQDVNQSLAEHVEFRLNVRRNSISGILFSHIVFVLTFSF